MKTDPTHLTDPYPENIDFEINREGLFSYHLQVWNSIAQWAMSALLFMVVGIPSIKFWDRQTNGASWWMVFAVIIGVVVTSGVMGWIMSKLLSLIWKKQAQRLADHFHVSVQGSFLRIKTGTQEQSTDRLIHFRSLVDYMHVVNPTLNKHGIEALRMETIGGGENTSITLRGLRNCKKIRNQLSEIDAFRENR